MKKFLGIIFVSLFIFLGCQNKETMKQKEQFVVGMECGYAPYNWTQSTASETTVAIDGGQYCDGYDVRIAQEIADKLNKQLVIKKLPWEGLILSLQSNQIDAIIAGMSPTEERKKEIAFSNFYYTGRFGVVVQNEGKYKDAQTKNDFQNARVTAQLGTFHVDLLDQLGGITKLNPMKDFPTMTVALKAGEIDGFITEESTGVSIERANPDVRFVLLDGANKFMLSEEFSGVSVGIKKDDTKLLQEVNAILAGVSDEQRNKMMEQAMLQESSAGGGFFSQVWQLLHENYPAFLIGTAVTLIISLSATFMGFLLGLFVAIIRQNKVGKFFAGVYITIFRGTPMIVQAMLLYYGTAMLIPGFKWANIPFGSMIAGIIVVTINTGAYMAETIRSGIQSLDEGQFEAAKSLGFSRWQTMIYIILPQAIRNTIPAIGNELIVNVKDTAVLNVIAVTELYFISNSVASASYKIFQTFMITSLIYLILTTTIAYFLKRIERHLNGGQKTGSYPASQTVGKQMIKKGGQL